MRPPTVVVVAALVAAVPAGCGADLAGRESSVDVRQSSEGPRGKDMHRDTGAPGPNGRLVPVLRVVDGDTLHVLRGGRDVTIRLIGIDTPEVNWYGGEAECFGAAAGRFLIDLLDGERVGLRFDEERIDPYGRTLAYLYTEDGRFVNALLVRRGFATVTIYEPNDRYEEQLRASEANARSSGAGLWSACG